MLTYSVETEIHRKSTVTTKIIVFIVKNEGQQTELVKAEIHEALVASCHAVV